MSVQKAKRYRKAVGGAMRQSGVIAAPCLVALDEIVPLLHKDHRNAKRVYAELASLDIKGLTLLEPETNILMFEIDTDADFVFDDAQFVNYMMQEWHICIHRWERNVFRFVFHHHVEPGNIEILLRSFKALQALANVK